MTLGKRIRRFMLYPLLAVWATVTLVTGSPFPSWDVESLDSPVAVKTMSQDGLLLEDGRTIKLPFVKRLPADDPLMLAAVEYGVEIAEDGKVFGLLWMNRTCGLDTCVWRRRRVNLSMLAAILVPDNIDDSAVPSEIVAEISERDSDYASHDRPRRYDNGRINLYDAMRMHRIEEALDYAVKWKKSDAVSATRSPVSSMNSLH